LARALYRNPWVLFLDEVASVLDAEAESEINKVSDALGGPVTIALYAHRLSTVLSTDKVIYLDNGRVVVGGIFAALQKKVPDFKNAVRLMGLETRPCYLE
jgi:ABC-type multidrug transport system fused ATPase/permease subunit